ncbi:putative transcriptional regulator, TetR family protein [Acidocella aquatica]|uniref:Transcriptional regulator, TetR family protein n=1 Tax=Acidocella aquatica TaxID=1922313 RepID=A0ABQ6A0V0_9PROT|nr:TetR/AcrR family transcriptional regulator [Acidocella aquatica]GLR65441.1 putative transcriptional regulator, TetR family protein [Acidocella aquatica]
MTVTHKTGKAVGEGRPVRRRDGPLTENKILAAAEELFARHGFDAVSTSQLAAAAGVAIGALYHHFPSKEALYAAAIKRAFADKSTPPKDILDSTEPPRRKLTRLVAWFTNNMILDRSFGLLLKRELLDPRPSTPNLIDEDLFRKSLDLTKDLLHQLVPAANTDEAVASMLALLFGFTNLKGIQAILPNVRSMLATPEDIAEHIVSLLLYGLVPPR